VLIEMSVGGSARMVNGFAAHTTSKSNDLILLQ